MVALGMNAAIRFVVETLFLASYQVIFFYFEKKKEIKLPAKKTVQCESVE
jgi:hypothetical protein